MARPKKEVETPEVTRVKIQWKNIHGGNGLKFLGGMVVEMPNDIFEALCDKTKLVQGNHLDAIVMVDSKKSLTHTISSRSFLSKGEIIEVPCLDPIK